MESNVALIAKAKQWIKDSGRNWPDDADEEDIIKAWVAGYEAAQNAIWAALTDFPDGKHHSILTIYTATLSNVIFNINQRRRQTNKHRKQATREANAA